MNSQTHIDTILEPGFLDTRFQPIIESRDGGFRTYAFEGLSRGPAGTNFAAADVLFAYARHKREESRIDRVCMTNVLRAAAQMPEHFRISLNVHASTLSHDGDFVAALASCAEEHSIPASRIIIEVVEHASAWDDIRLERAISSLRDLGAGIALDDIGVGLSNYRMMIETRPDYFKVDRFFVTGAYDDRYRSVVIESIAQLASKFGARVIAEGVESESDLRHLIDLGVDLFQGYYFAMPVSALAAANFPCDVSGLLKQPQSMNA